MGRSKVLHGFIYGIYHRLPKMHPPFLHTTLRQKRGGGVCSNIQFFSCIRSSLRSSQSLLHTRSTIKTTAAAFWKNSSFDEHVLQESAAFVCILSQEASKQLALSVVTGDNPM